MALDIGLDGNDAPEIQGNLPWDTWVGSSGPVTDTTRVSAYAAWLWH